MYTICWTPNYIIKSTLLWKLSSQFEKELFLSLFFGIDLLEKYFLEIQYAKVIVLMMSYLKRNKMFSGIKYFLCKVHCLLNCKLKY